MSESLFPLLMFLLTVFILLLGFPVAFSLAGAAILFAFIGSFTEYFDPAFLQALPERIYGIIGNETLLAVPLFVFMGVMLERSGISEALLDMMSRILGFLPGGLGISVCLVGGILAASTGIVGATVVTMGLISLPTMLKRNYSSSLASGIICASGTLGQIIPPSIVLIILGDVMSSANQQAQLAMGSYAPSSVSVGDLFVGALIPGTVLMLLYIGFVFVTAFLFPKKMPPVPKTDHISVLSPGFLKQFLSVLVPPILLILGVLGSILFGIATPTEAASVGGVGAIALAAMKGRLTLKTLKDVLLKSTEINTMVFTILIGASVFSLVFRGFAGDEWVQELLMNNSGGVVHSFLIVMLVMFILGFFLDFFEITFVIIPLVGPALIQMGLNPVWLGVMIALNLQTSFLTPPFGFSLFYLRGVAPESVSTLQIYKGAIPFILIQLFLLVLLWFFPKMATELPRLLFSS